MQLREWIRGSGYSIKSFAEQVQIERAMIYRYFGGAIPRTSMLRRIELLTGGAVTAQDFYDNAIERWKGKDLDIPKGTCETAATHAVTSSQASMRRDGP